MEPVDSPWSEGGTSLSLDHLEHVAGGTGFAPVAEEPVAPAVPFGELVRAAVRSVVDCDDEPPTRRAGHY